MPDGVNNTKIWRWIVSGVLAGFMFYAGLMTNWQFRQDDAVACKVDAAMYKADQAEDKADLRELQRDVKEILRYMRNGHGK